MHLSPDAKIWLIRALWWSPVALILVIIIAASVASNPSNPSLPVTTAPAPSSAPASPNPALTCTTDVDGSQTTADTIHALQSVVSQDTAQSFSGGYVTNAEAQVLNNAALNLADYSGGELSSAGQDFADDVWNWDPDDAVADETNNVPDGSYASNVLNDIQKLGELCKA
jgi:hypothetical protein